MLKIILGIFIGANLSLVLFSCIIAGKKEDEKISNYIKNNL